MSDTKSRILEALLAARDEGREPDLDQLRRKFPGCDADIARLSRAAEQYDQSVPEVEAPCGVGPGDRVGDFVVERLLGAGGMGHVFLAHQQSLGQRHVALKVLPGAMRSDANLRRFKREAVLLAELHHPRLAEIYGFGEEAGIQYIAMRYIDGRTLHGILSDLAARRLDPPEDVLQVAVLRWAIDIAEALVVVHRAGMVHHDVKPSNIILEEGDLRRDPLVCDAVLVDFGLVRAADTPEMTRTGQSAATPAYASPEQLLSLDTDASSDVFSLGVTLHDLLTRRLPKQRGSAAAGLEHLGELVPGIDSDLAAVVQKMLEPSAQWRYTSALPLLGDLRALEAGEVVSARYPPFMERVQRWTQRNPGRLLRLGIGVLALFGVLVLGSFLLDSYSQASQARRAWDNGDVIAMARGASEGSTSGGWFLGDEELSGVLDALRDERGKPPVWRVAQALRNRNTARALREAATPLRVNGIDSDPFLARFLLRSLAIELGRDGSREVEVLQIISRLFFERPVERASDLEASAPFRMALLNRWRRPELALHERLPILSAFSGLGRPEDVAWILKWSFKRHSRSEENRLALRVGERILRRATTMEDYEGVDQATLQRASIQAASPAYDGLFGDASPFSTARSSGIAAAEFARALALYRRSAGLLPGIVEMLPDLDAKPELATDPMVLLLRAAGREPKMLNDLMDGSCLTGRSPGYFYGWGLHSAMMGEGVEMQRVRTALRSKLSGFNEAQHVNNSARFEEGFLRGQDLVQGIGKQYDPDENTRMGYSSDESDWAELELERVPSKGPKPKSLGGERSVLHWRFSHAAMLATGPIESVRARLVEQTMDVWNVGYLLMSQPGLSELRMRFQVDSDPGFGDWGLLVTYQLGARAYMPYQGEASFEILLDQKPLDRGRLRFVRDFDSHRVWLPRELLVPGEHELSLRLGPSTNTTFRLMGLEILAPR